MIKDKVVRACNTYGKDEICTYNFGQKASWKEIIWETMKLDIMETWNEDSDCRHVAQDMVQQQTVTNK
jgi:hypothetical protein